MNETMVLVTLGPLTVTAYSLLLALGALAASLLTVLLGKRRMGAESALSLCLAVIPGAVIGARLVYCLTMIDSVMVDFGGLAFIPKLWEGGFTLYGAVLGGMLSAWVYARATHRAAAPLLDSLAPGASLLLCVARAAEYFTSQGLGDYLEDEAMWRFPFAVEGAYGTWQMPVFLYEAVAAAVLLAVTLCVLRRGRAGRTAEVFVILLGLTQIILESWREDEFIRFGFVRFNQLAAAITVAAAVALSLARQIKARGWTLWQALRIALFLLGVAVVILIEFALDKSTIDNTILYAVMAATLVVMGAASLVEGRRR